MVRTHIGLSLLAAVAVVCGLTLHGQTPPVATTGPTYSKDVAPILNRNCVGCHRPGEIGPMALRTYDEVRPWARAIERQVSARTMPPWHADAPHGTFENERGLTQAEIDTIATWAKNDAPRGDPKDGPAPPTFSDGWTIGTPDLIVSMPQPYAVPARGTVDYQYFEAPVPLTEDKWIEAMEVRPGARSVVHHVIVYERESTPTQRSRFVQQDPKIAVTPRRPDEQPRQLGYQLAAVATGTEPSVFRAGTARLLKAGSTLTFQVHYTTNGTAVTDQTRIGFRFAKRPPEHELRSFNMINGSFVIPPGAADYRVEAGARFLEDVTLYAMLPHTHLRGRRWEYTLTYPDGRSERLFSVPKYDFAWQTDYTFREPRRIPKGTTLTGVAWYDNSPANRVNPDPNAEVRWGDQTWEEMQFTAVLVSVDAEVRSPGPAQTTASGRPGDRK